MFIYVVDDRGKLIDDLRIREVSCCDRLQRRSAKFAIDTFAALKVNDSQEAALNVFRKYDRVALPVVDSNGVLVGIVTSDDMLDVAEAEATEDIQKLGGMEALDEPYTTIPFLRMLKKARNLADSSFSRRNAYRHGDAGIQQRDRKGGNSRDVPAFDHLERRQFRVAGDDSGHSRDGV